SIGIAEQSIMNSNIKRGSYETSKERLRSWGIPLPCRRPLSQEFLRRSFFCDEAISKLLISLKTRLLR
ncbi:MAG: hypothetical protein K8I29_18685, partial [Alphaproteobacteria bacterium]|nr:hypothetical protein [Candidatus Nitrobium versatile]